MRPTPVVPDRSRRVRPSPLNAPACTSSQSRSPCEHHAPVAGGADVRGEQGALDEVGPARRGEELGADRHLEMAGLQLEPLGQTQIGQGVLELVSLVLGIDVALEGQPAVARLEADARAAQLGGVAAQQPGVFVARFPVVIRPEVALHVSAELEAEVAPAEVQAFRPELPAFLRARPRARRPGRRHETAARTFRRTCAGA